ncbi:MAG: CRISPR-associated helicase Cas3' [Deferribacterales bacterium]
MKEHLLCEHLTETADLAAYFAKAFGQEEYGKVLGLLHDIGKSSDDFQRRIRGDSQLQTDHSTAGAVEADRRYKSIGRLLAYCIAGHHSGLPNGTDESDSCLTARLKKEISQYELSVELPQNIPSPNLKNCAPSHSGFLLTLLIRMLYSCLVDADYLDTERFMQPELNSLRENRQSINAVHLAIFNRYIKQFAENTEQSAVNTIRNEILNHCVKASESSARLLTLLVPTGGGKTLSSMAFALNHAVKRNLPRIIYVIPFTSIIEQNAKIFRSIFGENDILEHHSNYEYKNHRNDEETEESYRMRLFSQNWDSPIVVTTAVQFFESLFSNRSSKCRKLHNIANSVIIFDEAQSIPLSYLQPCLTAVNLLCSHFNCTAVFCTATQPALGSEHLKKFKLENVKEIIPDPGIYFDKLKRVSIHNLGKMHDSEIIEKISAEKTSLTIVNSRKHAFSLFQLLKNKKKNVFHLSTLMCPAHRNSVFAECRELLDNKQECTLISTQLIEAGVDIDFPTVFRAKAGADSIAQAAGRCNRNGKIKQGRVFLFESAEHPVPKIFRQQADAAEETTRLYQDILDPQAIEHYFGLLYWSYGKLDKHCITDMINEGAGSLDFPFKSIAEKFKLIDSDTVPVIIRYNEETETLIRDIEYSGNFRRLQKYTVQLFENEFRKIRSHISTVNNMFHILESKDIYSSDTGINIFEDGYSQEDYIF